MGTDKFPSIRRERSHCKSLLYLLVTADGSAFKIGVSINPWQRMKSIPCQFNLNLSYFIPCGKGGYKTETVLHMLFSEFNEIRAGDGGTEFFSAECFGRVLEFLASNRDILALGEMYPGTMMPPSITTRNDRRKVVGIKAGRWRAADLSVLNGTNDGRKLIYAHSKKILIREASARAQTDLLKPKVPDSPMTHMEKQLARWKQSKHPDLCRPLQGAKKLAFRSPVSLNCE